MGTMGSSTACWWPAHGPQSNGHPCDTGCWGRGRRQQRRLGHGGLVPVGVRATATPAAAPCWGQACAGTPPRPRARPGRPDRACRWRTGCRCSQQPEPGADRRRRGHRAEYTGSRRRGISLISARDDGGERGGAWGAERLLHETTSLCRECKNAVPARGAGHGRRRGLDVQALRPNTAPSRCSCRTTPPGTRPRADTGMRPRAPRQAVRPVEHGCPFDCGPCELHQQKVELPVVTITSACNLDCPICYVHNKNEGAFHMARGGLPAHPRSPGRRPRQRAGHHQLHRRRADAAPAADRVPGAGAGGGRAPGDGLLERPAPGPRRGAGASGWRALGARVALSFDTFEAGGRSGAAGGAAAGHQAALPGPAGETRRRHHADPGDDPRGERPRDRADHRAWACSGPTSATWRSTP